MELNKKELKRIATEESKAILRSNKQKLKKLNSRKYTELYGAIQSELYLFLLKVINFWLKRNTCMVRKGKRFYFLGTNTATEDIRDRSTSGVSNRWINYLCAIGLLTKIDARIDYTARNPKIAKGRTKKRNKKSRVPDYIRDKIREVNCFEVIEYTKEHLQMCNERAKLLQRKNITRGNISYNMLALNGLGNIAEEVYLERRTLAEKKKIREAEVLVSCMDSLIEEKGFTTKAEIYKILENEYNIKETETRKLFVLFQNELWLNRKYKMPSKAEADKYGLKSNRYIIIKK